MGKGVASNSMAKVRFAIVCLIFELEFALTELKAVRRVRGPRGVDVGVVDGGLATRAG